MHREIKDAVKTYYFNLHIDMPIEIEILSFLITYTLLGYKL